MKKSELTFLLQRQAHEAWTRAAREMRDGEGFNSRLIRAVLEASPSLSPPIAVTEFTEYWRGVDAALTAVLSGEAALQQLAADLHSVSDDFPLLSP